MHNPRLSVVIGSYNRLPLLHQCIQSIFECSIPIKIYVTDAGSKDGSVEYLQSLDPARVTSVFHPQKLGQARAYNEIFFRIQTPYTCWLSDDNIIVNNSLATAVSILESELKIGMVALKVRDMQGPFANSPYIGGISSCGILNVNQGVLRTQTLQRLGGFSEVFMDYGIDPDLTARVLLAGHDIVYTRSVGIQHWRDWGLDHQLASQMQKQKAYKALYHQAYSYANIPPKQTFLSRRYRQLGRWMKKIPALRGNLYSQSLLRDINNMLGGTYISLYDPIRCFGKPYYLRQSLRGPAKLIPQEALPGLEKSLVP